MSRSQRSSCTIAQGFSGWRASRSSKPPSTLLFRSRDRKILRTREPKLHLSLSGLALLCIHAKCCEDRLVCKLWFFVVASRDGSQVHAFSVEYFCRISSDVYHLLFATFRPWNARTSRSRRVVYGALNDSEIVRWNSRERTLHSCSVQAQVWNRRGDVQAHSAAPQGWHQGQQHTHYHLSIKFWRFRKFNILHQFQARK